MESGDLRVFQAVAAEGSITKAAAKLNYVQSNVTARIRQLEEDLHTVLFHRHNRGMTLTAGGKSLLEYANKILGLLEEASRAVTSSTEPRGPLAIGATQSCAAVRLPLLLAQYHRRYPDVSLSLSTGHSSQVLDKVLRYEVDGAFLSGPVPHDEVIAIPAFDEDLALVSEYGMQELADAAAKPILVFTDGCHYRSVLEEWLRNNDWKSPQIMEFGTLEAIIGGVSAGLGITLLPQSVVAQSAAAGSVRTHDAAMLPHTIRTNFVMRKDAFVSRPLQLFLDELTANQSLNEEALP
ncbi:LysR family transcriptional regulator [Cohnella nanjingensis]|uniref:LysR family transcriptional regulator n=1 Tax=Cohnella nanjingensis TaxID=1387779 RepID=A0A7X0VEU1_9BACL|nr:LysR family transcriptional regulator [Cohnella nanjingensis]MBB6669924.1 LysR family transcriptional regulator [Cohnella nanjingensis]